MRNFLCGIPALGRHFYYNSLLSARSGSKGILYISCVQWSLRQKKVGLGRPLKALRPLEGPGEARDHQGPPGINAVVKRNRLSQKKFRPRPAFNGLETAGGFWGGQRLKGTTRDQCCHQKEPFEPKKISASAGL